MRRILLLIGSSWHTYSRSTCSSIMRHSCTAVCMAARNMQPSTPARWLALAGWLHWAASGWLLLAGTLGGLATFGAFGQHKFTQRVAAERGGPQKDRKT